MRIYTLYTNQFRCLHFSCERQMLAAGANPSAGTDAPTGASGSTPASASTGTVDAKGQDSGAVEDHETVAILDAGAQYGKVIDRRVRELCVHSEILPLSSSPGI
jgi:hypothetical protein